MSWSYDECVTNCNSVYKLDDDFVRALSQTTNKLILSFYDYVDKQKTSIDVTGNVRICYAGANILLSGDQQSVELTALNDSVYEIPINVDIDINDNTTIQQCDGRWLNANDHYFVVFLRVNKIIPNMMVCMSIE